MEHSLAIAAIVIAILGFFFGQRNKVNDDYIRALEKKLEGQDKRIVELESKVLDCEKDRKMLRDYVEKVTRPAKILFVEDEEATRTLFEKLTSSFNREIVTAPTGRTALELFDADNYDLILLDINLPDMSGIEVFKRMKASNRKTRVVFLSGYCDPAQLIEASKWGYFSFALKSENFNRGFMEELLESHGVKAK